MSALLTLTKLSELECQVAQGFGNGESRGLGNGDALALIQMGRDSHLTASRLQRATDLLRAVQPVLATHPPMWITPDLKVSTAVADLLRELELEEAAHVG